HCGSGCDADNLYCFCPMPDVPPPDNICRACMECPITEPPPNVLGIYCVFSDCEVDACLYPYLDLNRDIVDGCECEMTEEALAYDKNERSWAHSAWAEGTNSFGLVWQDSRTHRSKVFFDAVTQSGLSVQHAEHDYMLSSSSFWDTDRQPNIAWDPNKNKYAVVYISDYNCDWGWDDWCWWGNCDCSGIKFTTVTTGAVVSGVVEVFEAHSVFDSPGQPAIVATKDVGNFDRYLLVFTNDTKIIAAGLDEVGRALRWDPGCTGVPWYDGICKLNSDCQSTADCPAAICKLHDDCLDDEGCPTEMICTEGVCEGDACTGDADCLNGTCSQGMECNEEGECEGGVCEVNSDCENGACRDSWWFDDCHEDFTYYAKEVASVSNPANLQLRGKNNDNLLVWQDGSGSNHSIKAIRLQYDEHTWDNWVTAGGQRSITSSQFSDPRNPHLIPAPAGPAAYLLGFDAQKNGGRREIYVARLDSSGGLIGEPVQVSEATENNRDAYGGAIVENSPANKTGVFWLERHANDSSDQALLVQTFDSNLTMSDWGPFQFVEEAWSLSYYFYPLQSMELSNRWGFFYLDWAQRNGENYWAVRYYTICVPP
ncbi:MAG: hypothetical protein JRJ19_10975, partial [Deltaproteobacteria bacterium]|nr:hypothetical protein [Deltaproteobacteria bacterium]